MNLHRIFDFDYLLCPIAWCEGKGATNYRILRVFGFRIMEVDL